MFIVRVIFRENETLKSGLCEEDFVLEYKNLIILYCLYLPVPLVTGILYIKVHLTKNKICNGVGKACVV